MPDTKISAMPVATTLAGTESIPVVQGGVNKRVPSLRAMEPLIATDATGAFPHFGVGIGAAPESQGIFKVSTSRDTTAVNSAWQFQRFFDTDTVAWAGNKNGVRVINTIGDGIAAIHTGICWSLSAEAVILPNVTASGDVTAVSGVVSKQSSGVNAIGMHAQVRCPIVYTDPNDVTPVVGFESNLPVVGLDNPAANNGFGNRFTVQLYARTDTTVSSDPGYAIGETGGALLIQHTPGSGPTDGPGYYRYGIVIKDNVNYSNPAGALRKDAIRIDTWGETGIRMNGGNTTANIYLDEGSATFGYPNAGLICNSNNYTSGLAIRINAGMSIGFDVTGSVRMKFDTGTSQLQFISGGVIRGHIDMAGSDHAL